DRHALPEIVPIYLPGDNLLVSAHDHTYRELHPDLVALVVLVFDLGLGQRRALDHAPHHGLAPAIELAARRHLVQFARDLRLGVEAHRQVGVVPLAENAEPLELLTLHIDPVFGKGPAFGPEFVDRHLVLVLAPGAILFLD